MAWVEVVLLQPDEIDDHRVLPKPVPAADDDASVLLLPLLGSRCHEEPHLEPEDELVAAVAAAAAAAAAVAAVVAVAAADDGVGDVDGVVDVEVEDAVCGVDS